jgi:SpoVK/Ycf46/Vps4 family AAA+-type ATPase
MIQGVSAADNFVIVGTTNRVHAIDEALLRDGRLSRTFHVDYPDKVGRE